MQGNILTYLRLIISVEEAPCTIFPRYEAAFSALRTKRSGVQLKPARLHASSKTKIHLSARLVTRLQLLSYTRCMNLGCYTPYTKIKIRQIDIPVHSGT